MGNIISFVLSIKIYITCKTAIVCTIVCNVTKFLNHVTHTYVKDVGETRDM